MLRERLLMGQMLRERLLMGQMLRERLLMGQMFRYTNKTVTDRGRYLNEFKCKWLNKMKHL
jgi:hypothetical protein